MKKIFLSFALFMFLSACATEQKYDEKLQTWVGMPETSLVKKWGSPSQSKILTNGDRVITYTKANDVYVPSEFYLNNPYMLPEQDTVYSPFMGDYDFMPYGETFGYKVEYVCQTSFLVQSGFITGWKWKGNDCFAN